MSVTISNVCNFIKLQSIKMWHRIKRARTREMRISETTITEDLLDELWTAIEDQDMPIRIFEAVSEKVNGNDLELFVKTADGYVLVALQAKILNWKGIYGKLWYKSGEKYQMVSLCEYAEKFKGVSGYLLFNYLTEEKQSKEFRAMVNKEHYGLTFVDTAGFKRQLNLFRTTGGTLSAPTFNQLHPKPAIPFHELICRLLNNRGADNQPLERKISNLRFYRDHEVVDSKTFHEMISPEAISFITPSELSRSLTLGLEEEQPGFHPKYRIIFDAPQNVDQGQ